MFKSIFCSLCSSGRIYCLFLIITVLSAIELTHITDLKGTLRIIIAVITVVLTVALVYYIFYRNQIRGKQIDNLFETDSILSNGFTRIELSVMLITLMAAIYFIICFVTPSFTVKYVFYYISMVVVVAIGIQSFLFLRYCPFSIFKDYGTDISTNEFKYGQSTLLFLYVIIGVIMNDIGAYFIGVLFGKHKMNERISPKKTWEGFLGGVVFSLISSCIFAVVVTFLGKPMLPIFNFLDKDYSYAAFFIVGISILLPLIADTGDFIFSAIKRYWGVKDFSKILPGHGGILDRIDSLIFSAALVSCLIVFINFFFYNTML